MSARAKRPASGKADVTSVLKELKRHGSAAVRTQMVKQFGVITADKTFGVRLADIQTIAKRIGHDNELAQALWDAGVYEAKILAAFVADPAGVTPAQMDRWRREFDNWGTVDTICFKLFDQTPHAFAKAEQWVKLEDEFGRRAGFVLIACLALHRKDAPDAYFRRALKLIEAGAYDERNFVKKGVSWALRSIGVRKSTALRKEALALARKLAASENATERWVGKDAVKALAK